MQYSLTAVLPAVLACFFPLTQALPSGLASRASIQQIADAQNEWEHDTGSVSQFLSALPGFLGQAFEITASAQAALIAETDELTHKQVLDAAFGSDPRIVAANDILVTQGKFQFVVDSLTNLQNNGGSLSSEEITQLLQSTNAVRCGYVLPAIDVYFRVAAEKLNNGGTLVAVRPNNC